MTATVTHPHELQPLCPALDNTVERKADRIPSCDARVEHGPVDQGTVIVHLKYKTQNEGHRRVRVSYGSRYSM